MAQSPTGRDWKDCDKTGVLVSYNIDTMFLSIYLVFSANKLKPMFIQKSNP